MLVAENVAVEAPVQHCVRVSGSAAVSFKGCKLDCGGSGLLVTELSTASLQSCAMDGCTPGGESSACGGAASRTGSTGVVVSCGAHLKAQDLNLSLIHI